MKSSPQNIVVFQQFGSGENKIKGIREYGRDLFDIKTVNIDKHLPVFIEDPEKYIPDDIKADLVLDYLKHPDLSFALAELCKNKGIEIVASGKKTKVKGIYTPPTCCGLKESDQLGCYGKEFGAPEFSVELDGDSIKDITVIRGAPCGATWEASAKVIGMNADDAAVRIGLETQFFCTADPAGWDPIYGKSPVHFAGNIHSSALKKAIKSAKGKKDI